MIRSRARLWAPGWLYFALVPLLVPALAGALAGAAGAQAFTLARRVNYPDGIQSQGLAAGDLDGDGRVDLVFADTGADSMQVLLGLGSGRFARTRSYPTLRSPAPIALADLDGDGRLDMVVGHITADSISVRHWTAQGQFGLRTDYAVGGQPVGVAVGDVNQDGRADIVVACQASNFVSVFLGNGAGGFAPRTDYGTGAGPAAVGIADLNHDGYPDIVVANINQSSVSVLLNTGGTGFATKVNYPVGVNPIALALGDLNGDGVPDLVVANQVSSTFSTLISAGNGTFLPHTDHSVSGQAFSIALGDVSGDGIPDVLVQTQSTYGFDVFTGDGAGGWFAHSFVSTADLLYGIALADADGDGQRDVVATAFATAAIFYNGGAPAFAQPVDFVVGQMPDGLAAADLNGDGKPDLACANYGSANVSVLLGNGDGAFARTDYPTGKGPVGVTAADVNADGKRDLEVTCNSNFDVDPREVDVLLNAGSGTFGAKTAFATGQGQVNGSTVADFTNDGKPDLATVDGVNNKLIVYPGDNLGGFGGGVFYTTGAVPIGVVAGDVNGNGKADALTAEYQDVSFFADNGSGAFLPRQAISTSAFVNGMALGDFDENGKLDLAFSHGSYLAVRRSVVGTFDALSDILVGNTNYAVLASDLDGDGHLDLAVANAGGYVPVLYGDGKGTFAPPVSVPAGAAGPGLDAADFDLDGRLDVAVTEQADSTVTILFARRYTRTALTATPNPCPQGATLSLYAAVTTPPPSHGAPTGQVRFYDGQTFLGATGVSAGAANFSLPAPYFGPRQFRAEYVGDGRFFGSLSTPLDLFVYTASADVPPAGPASALALEPVRPNPLRAGPLTVSFTLPTAVAARLELLDVRGRLVTAQQVGALGPGRHAVSLAERAPLAPGVYLVRLTQGAAVRTVRAVVLGRAG